MRIALISPYDLAYPGGVTNHIDHLSAHLRGMGHEVRVIGPTSRPEAITDKDNTTIIGKPISLPYNGSVARIAFAIRLPLMSAQVKRVLRHESFDVVHVHEPLVPLLPITFLRFSSAINVGTFHACLTKSRSYYYGRRILKRWFRKLDGKIAVSKPAADFVSHYFPGYYNIIPNGIDMRHFAEAGGPLPEFDDGKLNILFVGRLEKRKGLKYLIEAYTMMKSRMPDSRLIIVGPGDRRRARYQHAIEERGIPDIVFTGFVSSEDLPRYYRTANIFCSPATGQESFGIVLLEAMAAGAPVVASRLEGFASVVTHGSEGILVEPGNAGDLAQALFELARDPGLRDTMGRAGQVRAAQFDWARVTQRVAGYYEQLLSEVRPASDGLPSVADLLRTPPTAPELS